MPEQSTILSLPHILPSQAQKHVTHNEALRLLDVMVQLSVTRSDLAAPPALPVLGDRYIVASGPSGAWAGHGKDIAMWNGTAWEFFPALRGWQAYDATAAKVKIFDGSAWVNELAGAVQFTELGVSMAASPTNRLAVESPATLFTNSTGSHQMAINKSLASATASVMLQQNYLTRAEIGLVGDNNLAVKVSPDGTTFATAMTINKDTARVTMEAPVRLNPAASDPSTLSDGELWYNSTTGKFRARQSGSTVDVVLPGGAGSNFSDASFLLEDNLDATKKAAFQLSGLTTGTTRTYTLPDTSATLAILSGAQTFSGIQTIAGTTALLVMNDTDAVLGGAASARMQFQKSGSLGAIIGYNGATDFTQVVYDGNLTLAADHDNNEAGSVITLMIDGTVVGQVEPTATAVSANSVLTGSKGDARYAQLGATNTLTGTFTASAALVSLGTNTGASTVNVGTGATLTATTKAVNLGTGGVSGSTTTVTLGSTISGALGATVIASPTLTIGSTTVSVANATSVTMPSATSVGMGSANVQASQLGLGGATADATNRLSLNAPGVLFNHAGTGFEATLNKASVGDNARVTFKNGFSTRAQFGLSGTDDFTLKVSADGTVFNDGLTVAAASGSMTLAKPLILTGQAVDPGAPVDGTIWYNSTTGQMKARAGAETRVIDAPRDLSWLTPVSGDYVLTTMGAGTTTGTAAGVAGRIDLFPFTARADTVVTGIAANCTTAVAASLGKFVVYDSDANGRPNALLVETADIDLGTVGVKTATASLTLRQGRTYWLGLRTSSTSTISLWTINATPDINGGAPVTSARKILRRTLAYATPATSTWGFLSSEISNAAAPAIWLRV